MKDKIIPYYKDNIKGNKRREDQRRGKYNKWKKLEEWGEEKGYSKDSKIKDTDIKKEEITKTVKGIKKSKKSKEKWRENMR